MKSSLSIPIRLHVFLSPVKGLLIILTAVMVFIPREIKAQDLWSDKWETMRGIVPRDYVCYRAETPVVIDGRFDDKAWRNVPWTDYFIDIEGDVKPRPRFRTQAKMLWDDQYFYVAADMQEPHVWGTLTYHDAIIFNDNDFEIFIDPDSDNYEYYEIEINALNAEWDLILRNTDNDKYKRPSDWEIPGIVTAVHVNGTLNDPSDIDRGWSVEFAIPWSVLGDYAHKQVPPAEGEQWRVNFSRVEWVHELVDGFYQKVGGRREDNWVWSPQGIINMHCPEKWGYVQFSSRDPGTVAYQPDPTEPARMVLMGIYYAQSDYRRVNGRYAPSLGDLPGLSATYEGLFGLPVLELTEDGFHVTVSVRLPGGAIRRLIISQDSKIAVE